MVKNTGIICVMYYTDNRYTKLAKVAHDSFVKFHKDEVATFLVTPENISQYTCSDIPVPAGIKKYMLACEIAKKYKSKKVIILGADTITCSRLDEFIDDDHHDILTTLDYPYQLVIDNEPYCPDSETQLNADVVCFNNIEALKSVIKASLGHCPQPLVHAVCYYEQGGLNQVVWVDNNFTNKTVDSPYDQSTVVYNARAKGNLAAGHGERPWSQFVQKFHVVDNKLFTGLHDNISIEKQIKVWHYCDGLGSFIPSYFEKLVNTWTSEYFNEETKRFFKEHCDSGDFFEKEFKI